MRQSRILFATLWLNIGREGAFDTFFLEKAITRSGREITILPILTTQSAAISVEGWVSPLSQFILGFSSCWGISLSFSTSESHSTVKEDSSGQSWIFVNLCRYIHYCVDEGLCFLFFIFLFG